MERLFYIAAIKINFHLLRSAVWLLFALCSPPIFWYPPHRNYFSSSSEVITMKKLTLKDVFRAAFSELSQETIKQYSYSYRVFARYVYINEPCIPYLKNYLRFRDQRKSPLFRTIDPRSKRFLPHGISRRVIYDTVSRLSEKAGRKINPHALRHSNVNLVISEIAKKGLGIDYLQAWTRHKDIKELDFYFDHPDVKQKAVSSMISKDIGKQKDIEPVPTEDDKFAMILKELAELKAKMP